MDEQEAAKLFIRWLEAGVLGAGRGDNVLVQDVEPAGKFWLGRLAPQEQVTASGLGDRGERLEPCATGLRVRPAESGPWSLAVTITAVAWLRDKTTWTKTERLSQTVSIHIDPNVAVQTFARADLEAALTASTGTEGLSAEVRVEVEHGTGGTDLAILLVNTSPAEHPTLKDTRLYECTLSVSGLVTTPYLLEALPDSFRYDRRVPAYGINCGVVFDGTGAMSTTETIRVARPRPRFWPASLPEIGLRFDALAVNATELGRGLSKALGTWGESAWSQEALDGRASREHWSAEMRREAAAAAQEFHIELTRIKAGLDLLSHNEHLNRSFRLMNRAMEAAARGKYHVWRPFQLGFILANLASIAAPDNDAAVADVVWFATGGGKTETYLGLLLTAAFYDRLTGKLSGITAWSRFPLRMLSLQQTQRFANALAAAEIVRRTEHIPGDSFALGFFVGQSSTPNSLSQDPQAGDPWDPDDDEMPKRLQVLDKCPFCGEASIEMAFNRRLWKVEHRCASETCPWPEESLPVFVVDDEIYRLLPTVVVGTLDKAAAIGMQASMRAFVAAPLGICPIQGHGYVYSPRSKRPKGCLVPGCRQSPRPLPLEPSRYAPTLRLQDELHLLRDSLGAVDSHYEAILDGLQIQLTGRLPKILASSATLAGYQKQVEILYRRSPRIFPHPPPSASGGFWVSDSDDLMRRFVAVAPRGVTIEYTVDRLLTELQRHVRLLRTDPARVCQEAGIDELFAPFLLSIYGTDVVYGNTLRDLDAVVRSAETQVQVSGIINTDSLTGRTDFEHVRAILRRLEQPEDAFEDRLHVVSASSMMSHGVDVDRLNVMVMLGLPLGTAEFIQATARIGRRYPGLVFVVHKIGRERDASIYRSFPQFIEQGDRFIEPIAITRRSRRVLDKTIAGIELARILAVHEPAAGMALSTVAKLRDYAIKTRLSMGDEAARVAQYLGLRDAADERLRDDLLRWFERFGRNLMDPPPDARFLADLSPTGPPMRSLRDVEEEVPVFGSLLP